MVTAASDERGGEPACFNLSPETSVKVFLGLGTNMGNKRANLRDAIARIAQIMRVDRESSIYETEPVGYADQPNFWNMVIEGTTDLPARQLMQELLRVEKEMGRVRTFPNAPRIIDLDMLLYDDVRINEPDLKVPHPRMQERAFVMVPLNELRGELENLPDGITKIE